MISEFQALESFKAYLRIRMEVAIMASFDSRRDFLKNAGLAGIVVLTLPKIGNTAAEQKPDEKVSPVEDLMREHGGLNRILLIYEENLRRMGSKQYIDPPALIKSAKIIRDFIENYHERLEEDFLFPRFEKAKVQVELVKTLRKQHEAGRALTGIILKTASSTAKNAKSRYQLQDALEKFIRMYRPHEAREDTILFPAFKKLVSEQEYEDLGEQFEEREQKLFGKEGFEGVIVQIAEIERSLGINELSKFTPKV